VTLKQKMFLVTLNVAKGK